MALVSISGCALDVGRDLVRRTLQIELDAHVEHPEQRPFKDGFLVDIAARRVELLQQILTILRWAKQNPHELTRGKSFGTYDEWERAVRDPLLSLDCPDPVRRLARLKVSDPDRIAIFEVFEKWEEHHGDKWVTAHSLHQDVQDLLLGSSSFSRQRVAAAMHRLLGTRLGFYLVEEKPKTDRWSAQEYRLIREAAPDAEEEEQQAQPQATPAPSPAADPLVANDEPLFDEADAWPSLQEDAANEATPGALDRWRRDPATAAREPCPGWYNLGEFARTLSCINQFFDGPLARKAEQHDWQLLDLVAVHRTVGVAARDCCGALITGARAGFVIAVEGDVLRFSNGLAARKRQLDPEQCVPIWAFNKQLVTE